MSTKLLTKSSNKKNNESLKNIKPEVMATLLVDVHYPNIFAVDESGHVVHVEPTLQQQTDPVFWDVLKRIAKAKIWIPVSKFGHHLLNSDWLAVE